VSLPAERSFLVQFHAEAASNRENSWQGRVEHVVSGHAARFEDWSALRRFVERTLQEHPSSPGATETGEPPAAERS